ncbi:hypothetical protein QCE62_03245 [Caballeronia sp. LZ033]|uniref:hypothetical protein n=1 Tax=Caballeronia sp. LZ033 TaxID=3038566 RepID=UPI00286655CD|nr:hypothetical protein [Caballeronia sp. LZ033]MDR5812607.1 hypothetical protein [Caballeronia sp. LZ033]
MLNIALGFFREYAPVIFGCAFMQFCVPGRVDWLSRIVFPDEPNAAAKGQAIEGCHCVLNEVFARRCTG